MNLRNPVSLSSRAVRRATTTVSAFVVAGACLAAAADASAQSIAVTASPNPTRPSATVTLTNVGTTNANPDATSLIYDYYQQNGGACAPTGADERNFTHGSGFISTIQVPQGNFSAEVQFVPVRGASVDRICAYLYSGGDDSVAPDALGTTILNVATRPAVITKAASNARTHSATAHGQANPDGAATRYYVQYGLTRHYGSRTAAHTTGGGFAFVPISAALHGLERHTTYHYRIVATNLYGTTRGKDRTLRTKR